MGARKEKREDKAGISHVYSGVLGKPRVTSGAKMRGPSKISVSFSDGAEEGSSVDIIRDIQKEAYANTSNTEI